MDTHSTLPDHEPLTDERRADLRARGYKPVELWVLDRESPAFKAELRRQAKIVASASTVDEYGDIDAFTEEMTRQAWADLPDYDWGEE